MTYVQANSYRVISAKKRGGNNAVLALVAVFICLSFGQIGKDLLYNPFRTGIQEDKYGTIFGYSRYAGLVLAIIIASLNDPSSIARATKRIASFIPFMFVIVASLGWTEDADVTRRYLFITIGLFAAAALIAENIGPENFFRVLVRVLACVAIASTMVALLVPSLGVHQASDVMEPIHAGRWRGVFSHKNTLGPYSAYCLIGLICAKQLLRFSKPFYYASLICSFLCCVESFSATAIVGLLVAMIVFYILNSKIGRKPILVGFLAAVLVFSATIAPTLVLDALGKDATFSGRTLIWNEVINQWQNAPLLGHGYMASLSWLAPLLQGTLFGSAIDAHSAYLEQLVDTGIIGLVCLMFPLLSAIVRGYFTSIWATGESRQLIIALIGCMVCSLLMGFGEVTPLRTVSDGYLTYMVTIILITAISRTKKQATRNAVPMSVRRLSASRQGPGHRGVAKEIAEQGADLLR